MHCVCEYESLMKTLRCNRSAPVPSNIFSQMNLLRQFMYTYINAHRCSFLFLSLFRNYTFTILLLYRWWCYRRLPNQILKSILHHIPSHLNTLISKTAFNISPIYFVVRIWCIVLPVVVELFLGAFVSLRVAPNACKFLC